MGLDGLDGPAFDAHLDAVSHRHATSTSRRRSRTATNEMMARGARGARALRGELLARNASPDDDPRFCGYCNAGCQQGCKQSTLKTYLQDASDAGARVVVDCAVDRVLVARRARRAWPSSRPARARRRADGRGADRSSSRQAGSSRRRSCCAPGSAARRSGKHLRLHPTYFVGGVYDEEVNAWDGQFQALASFDFTHAVEGTGFLVESVNVSLPFWAARAAVHERRRAQGADAAAAQRGLVARGHARHGAGEVVLGDDGEPVVRWAARRRDRPAVAARVHVELARLHHARGAERS